MESEQTGDIGIVKATNGNMLTIEIARGGGCKSCAMNGLCGTGNTPIVLHLESMEHYMVGDRLIMEVAPSTRIMSAVIIFLFPLLLLFVTFIIASRYFVELYSVLFALGSMIIAFMIVRLIDKKVAKAVNFRIGGKYEDLSQ